MAARKTTTVNTAFTSYSLGRIIGEGGTGRVYAASSDGRDFAVKVLNAERSTTERRKRFQNEITFCVRNQHPNIITVIDYGITNTSVGAAPFYVMPRYASSFRSAIAPGGDPSKKLRLFAQVLDGVEAAHRLGVIHRDIKPENILLNAGGDRSVVCDWGVARFAEADLFTEVKTHPNTRLANFRYAAPEQRIQGAEVSQTADIFALGLILNELFTGYVPSGTSFQLVGEVDPQLAYLDDIVASMISQKPQSRPQSIDDIKKDLIGRKKEFVVRQKLVEAERRVVSVSTDVDPLLSDPPMIEDFEWAEGVLTLILSHPVSNGWIEAFRNMGSHTSVFRAGPENFRIAGNRAVVGVGHDRVQDVIDHFKGWLPNVTAVYKARQDRLRNQAEAAEKRVLQEERAELDRQLALRKSIKL